jgi:hypothetical protein
VSIPATITELIKSGQVTCHSMICSSGIDVWFRLTEPGKECNSITADEVLNSFKNKNRASSSKSDALSFQEVNVDSDEDYTAHMDQDEGIGLGSLRVSNAKNLVPMTIKQARKLVSDRNLIHYREKGILQTLPSTSLTMRDFGRQLDSFVARAFCVAHDRGEGRLWGIIGNQVPSYDGAHSFALWWKAATSTDKAKLLSDHKSFNVDDMTQVHHCMMDMVSCPF